MIIKSSSHYLRNEKFRIGREERRQKYDLTEEKREVFRDQIRQKYGIKSKDKLDLEKVMLDLIIYVIFFTNMSDLDCKS